MNTLRRFLLILYGLILLAAAGGIGILAWNQDDQLDLTVQDLNLQALVTADDAEKYILTAILTLIGLLALLTVIVALWPQRKAAKGALRIRQADGGTVEVTSASIESLLKGELEALPEVETARPRVTLAGGAVDTYLDVQIEPSTSIASATKLLGATVEEVLREQVGVTSIRRPTIRITYNEMAARPIGPRDRAPVPDLRAQRQVAYSTETGSVSRPPEAPAYTNTDEDSPAQ